MAPRSSGGALPRLKLGEKGSDVINKQIRHKGAHHHAAGSTLVRLNLGGDQVDSQEERKVPKDDP